MYYVPKKNIKKKSVFPNQLYNQSQLSNSNIKFGDLNSNIVHNQFILQIKTKIKNVLDSSKNNVLMLIFLFLILPKTILICP